MRKKYCGLLRWLGALFAVACCAAPSLAADKQRHFNRLERLALVNTQRIMVLRSVSNYSIPPRDQAANWSVTAAYPDNGQAALDTAWREGSKVIDTLVKHWPRDANAHPNPISTATATHTGPRFNSAADNNE